MRRGAFLHRTSAPQHFNGWSCASLSLSLRACRLSMHQAAAAAAAGFVQQACLPSLGAVWTSQAISSSRLRSIASGCMPILSSTCSISAAVPAPVPGLALQPSLSLQTPSHRSLWTRTHSCRSRGLCIVPNASMPAQQQPDNRRNGTPQTTVGGSTSSSSTAASSSLSSLSSDPSQSADSTPVRPFTNQTTSTSSSSNSSSSSSVCKSTSNGDGLASTRSFHVSGAPLQSLGYGSAPPPSVDDLSLWTHELLTSPVPPPRRVFCNRALNMSHIKALGWDMDYTLAQYRPETFEALAHSQTVEKLVNVFGYPEILKSFTFCWDYMMKGIIIDKARGNILKVDRHKYVKLAYHGFTEMTAAERKAQYNTNYQGLNFDSDEFGLVDTLFSLAEAYLYCQLVELKDSPQACNLKQKTYTQLYKDLRTAVDMCHRDGSLKKAVAANPERYIHKDPLLAHMLAVMRDGGRRLFLATNSLWDYTNVVMNYLLSGKTGTSKTVDWLNYFDVVIVGCGKPGFFNNSGQLFHVDVKTGLLSNTDNGAPILPVDEADRADVVTTTHPVDAIPVNKHHGNVQVFQGGCYRDLHRMLGITSGDQVLYVGDHIYGDIVKSKKAIGWRTMLVVPELHLELQLQEETKMIQAELHLLRQERAALEDQIQRFQWAIDHGLMPLATSDSYKKNMEILEELRLRLASLRARHSRELKSLHSRHHPIWGQILKTGYQNSRFAHQIERFACLYTSHVSNLAYVSPSKMWQGRLDFMAHEDISLGESLTL